MKNTILLSITICYTITLATAQDTIQTTYPNSSSRWQKIYEGGEKVAENIYHKNGVEWMTVRYEAEEVEVWKWYYDNGNPYFEATIIDDELQGSYKIWYESGKLAERLVFKDNIENGEALFYHPNGRLAMKGYFQEGEMVGDWQFFDVNGDPPTGNWTWTFAASPKQLRMEGQLKNGRRVGAWRYSGTADLGRLNQLRFEEVY
jgi:hypothetical protein